MRNEEALKCGVAAIPWEHGSDFHWLDFEPVGGKADHPWRGGPLALFGSGRDALRALLARGAASLGWKRVFIPTFFCQEVAGAMRMPGLELAAYQDAPGEVPVWPGDLAPGDAVLVVNFFGLREEVDTAKPQESGAAIIEDHTHDPWSPWARSSKADFSVVALRKTLPVPEGGVVWSPRGHGLPAEPPITEERQRAADDKRAGMLLKSLYLAGHAVAKDDFRALLLEGEQRIASGAISGITSTTRALLDCFPVASWRDARKRNFETLAVALKGVSGLIVLKPKGEGCVPFNATIVADTPKLCETLRTGLIARRIYPAVLWSLDEPVLDGLPATHIDLSNRIMSLACDMRYGAQDMQRIFKIISEMA